MRVLHPRPLVSRGARLAAGLGLACVLAAPVGSAAAQTLTPPVETGPSCSIQFHLSNPSPGDQQVPRSLMISGTALDQTAPANSGNGISEIQAFIGNRDAGGMFVGSATFSTMSPDSWSMLASIPNGISGGQDLFMYATSSVTGQQAVLDVPIVVGEQLPTGITVSDTFRVSCPSIVLAPSGPPVTAGGGGGQ
jgi:hypothetical protein